VLSLMDGSGQAYAAKPKPNFTCMAASGSGHVVVGSEDGKIRLFSSKTLKPVRATCGNALIRRVVGLCTPMGIARAGFRLTQNLGSMCLITAAACRPLFARWGLTHTKFALLPSPHCSSSGSSMS
jgi:hypothetical protein